MPELPEVEAASRLVASACLNKKVVDVIGTEQGGGPRDGLFDEIVCCDVRDGRGLAAALVGRTLLACLRKGKQMFWTLSGGPAALSPLWHFGMTGCFSVKPPGGAGYSGAKYRSLSVDAASQWPPKFTKAELVFDDGTRLALTDPRRLARIRLVAGDPRASPPLSLLGPDAHLALPPLPAFAALLAPRAVPIKALLLDQSVLAGLGNYLVGASREGGGGVRAPRSMQWRRECARCAPASAAGAAGADGS